MPTLVTNYARKCLLWSQIMPVNAKFGLAFSWERFNAKEDEIMPNWH